MEQRLIDLFDKYLNSELIQIIFSNPANRELLQKVKLRPVLLKQELMFQLSEYRGTKVLHANYTKTEAISVIEGYIPEQLRQAEISSRLGQAIVLISKKGTVTIKDKSLSPADKHSADTQLKNTAQPLAAGMSHNSSKQYILSEGMQVPFMVDLGIMTTDGQIVRSRYDKFRQINRYLEFIEDILPSLPRNKELSIIDFGCGKSYLTFAMYYYLKELKGYNINITGLDLKADVISTCNELATRYGYDRLHFIEGDIANFEGTDSVDMVVTLHACDTATDYALYKAVRWNAKVILCVPCCQHELNKQIKCDAAKPLFKYGLIKERIASLVTDGLRASILEEQGYVTQVLEFIDMEHTPKNILIRATKSIVKDKNRSDYRTVMRELGVTPTLYKLLYMEDINEVRL